MDESEGQDQSLPASAIEARAIGSGHYFTGKRCRNGHFSKRRASDNKCLECDKGNAKRRRADPNLNVVINEQRKAWRENNQEKYQVVLADRRRAYQKSDRIKDRIYFNLWASEASRKMHTLRWLRIKADVVPFVEKKKRQKEMAKLRD